MSAAEIAPGLYWLPGVRMVGAYVWRPQGGAPGTPMVFDCGWPWSGAGLAASLIALGCRPETVATIAVTHDDIDHVGRLGPLAAISAAQVIAGRNEVSRLAGTAWRRSTGTNPVFNTVTRLLDRFYQRFPHHGVRVSQPVDDGAGLPDGWQAVTTPGHTPGHTSYWYPAQRLLVAGDALGNTASGRLRFPMSIYTEDRAAAAGSIRRLAGLEPDVIVFGHGPALFGAAASLRAFADSLA